MVHKFVSNNNKGKVNTMEIGPDYTKIHNVVDPTADGDPVNKKYFEDNLPESSGGLFIIKAVEGVLDKKYSEILAAAKTSLVVLMDSGDDYVEVLYLYDVGENDGSYYVEFYDFGVGRSVVYYTADAADGFPETDFPGGDHEVV